jgi:serine/threonine-protein kinase ATR
MLDAMGVAGYEGVFRRVAETTMAVLRGQRDMLISALEPFIHDPSVEWTRRSRHHAAGGAAAAPADPSAIPDTAAGGEAENHEGAKYIRNIGERLNGYYNQGPDAVEAKKSGGRARRTVAISLSIPGQVHRLLKEATSDENLVRMYVGWMPFL